MCRCLCRDVSVCGKVLAVIVLPSLPLILCKCWLLSSSPEDRSSTRGSCPRSLHYLWPVVKLTPLLLWPTSSLPPNSQANYQRYHLFERDAAQMKRMRVAGEPVRVEKRWLRMREGANMGSDHGPEQRNSVKEGANERESRAQGTLVGQLTITVLCLSSVPPTSFCFALLEVGTPTSHKNEFITRFYLPHQRPPWSAAGAFQQPSHTATFTSAKGKAQLDFHLRTAEPTLQHGRNTNIRLMSSC